MASINSSSDSEEIRSLDSSALAPQELEQSQTNNLRLTKTETKKSLEDLGLSSDIPQPDIVNPPVQDPIFPEEYTLETDTGLVKVGTLHSLGRVKPSLSKQMSGRSGRSLRTMLTGRSKESSHNARPGEGEAEKEELEESEPSYEESQGLDPEIELVTFTKDDPENPHNWPFWLKWVYTIIFSMLVICAAYGSSCLATGLFTINEKFGVGTEVSTLSVSVFVIGFGVGSMVWSPLSEQPFFGRRLVYFISFGLYVIFNIPCGVAKNIQTVIICRFLCGCFASSALANAAASLVDMHNETRGLAIALFSFCPYSGPVIGGFVNGFISVGTGRYDLMIWVNMAFAGVMWILVCLIPETYAPTILRKRAIRLRKETGNHKIMTEQEATPLSLSEVINIHMLRPVKFIFVEPTLLLVCVYVSLIYSMLYAFFFAYPVIFSKLYGFKDNLNGLMFIPILIGAIFGVSTTPFLESRYKKLCKVRKPEPEDRLIGAMIGCPFPCIALFILGATSWKHIIWVGPASAGIAFGYGMVLVYYSLNNYIIDTYAKVVASALGTKVITRSCMGAAFPLFITQMYNGMGLQWASWLLAFVALAMCLIPFLFYKFGKTLRAKLCKEDYSFVHT